MAREQALRSTPSLAEIEPLLREVDDVHHLGIHLEVPTEKLKQFGRDHPHYTARQRTEVLTYWRNNCSDATWERLAAAVEKVGGHGNLVRRLRELALESSLQDDDMADDDVTFSTPPESPEASDDSHTEDIDVFEHISALPPIAAGATVAAGELDESSLASATKELTLEFTTLFTSVRLSLEKLQVSPESVLSHLKSIEAIAPIFETVYISKSEKFEKTLSKAIKSLEDLFPAIAPYCSWFNHLLVENIIKTFCEDDDKLSHKWEKFKEKRAEYCESRLCQCPLDQFGEDYPHADTTPVVMKIDKKWNIVKVSQLDVILDTVAQILKIKPHNLYLRAVKNGCIELTFYIPSFIAIRCLPPSTEQITALQNEGISFIQYARVWALAIEDADKIDDLREVVMKRVREVEVSAESAGKDIEIHQLQQELEYEQAERTRAEEQLQQKDAEVQSVNSELRTQLQQKARDLEIKQAELTRAEEQFEIVNTKLQQAESQLEQKAQKEEKFHQIESELTQTRAQVKQQAAELDRVHKSFQSLCAELEGREARLRAQEKKMQQRDAEINRLMEELRKCQAGLQRQQKLLSELEDTEALLNPLEKELQRQVDELDRFMKERSHLEKQLEKLLAISKSEERDGTVAILKLKEDKGAPLPQHMNSSGIEYMYKGQLKKQTPLADQLKIPLKLEWRRGRDMPFGMDGHIQAVAIGDNVYVGGGDGSIFDKVSVTMMVYSVQTASWTILRSCAYSFGMAAVNNQLVLVGGILSASSRDQKVTNVLLAWDERSQGWTCPFPVMPTSRHSMSVTSYKKWLVVAGGIDKRNSYLNKVELLDTQSGQWYEGSPLPTECSDMSSAINGNMWYLSGGWSSQGANEHVFSVCLDELISQAVSQSASSTSSPWQTLPEAPLTHSTVLILNGALLTVGGENSSSIHLYQPGRRSWVKVGDLPSQRWQCACAVLPNGEMFVAGGYSDRENKHMYNYIATVVIDNQ